MWFLSFVFYPSVIVLCAVFPHPHVQALLEFVAARGFSHWQSLSEDPVLRERHTDPEVSASASACVGIQ